MANLSLSEIHKKFIAAVYKQEIDGQAVDANEFVSSQGGHSPEERLAVYRGSVFGNLTQALGDIYPAVKACLGEQFFDAMAVKYIQDYPSQSASLDDYGENLSVFMADFPPLNDLPYLPELAQMEWAWHRAFHAPDDRAMDVSTLADLDAQAQAALRLTLNRSMAILASDYPIAEIWRDSRGLAVQEELDLASGGGQWLIWRDGYDMRVDDINELEYAMLLKIKEGKNFGTLCEDLLSKFTNQEIIASFARAIEKGWFV